MIIYFFLVKNFFFLCFFYICFALFIYVFFFHYDVRMTFSKFTKKKGGRMMLLLSFIIVVCIFTFKEISYVCVVYVYVCMHWWSVPYHKFLI